MVLVEYNLIFVLLGYTAKCVAFIFLLVLLNYLKLKRYVYTKPDQLLQGIYCFTTVIGVRGE